MPHSTRTKMAALLMSFGLVAAACGSDTETTSEAATPTTAAVVEEAMADDEAMADELPATVVDIAASSDDFSTLVAAVTEAQLAGTLQGDGPFTVFAPTNAAFADALAALDLTAEELLASPELEGILTYHVVAGEVDAAAAIAAAGTEVPTVNGDTIEVSVVDGNVMIDGATVTTADLRAGNGIVHVIDSVILPAGFGEMAMEDEAMAEEAMAEELPATVVDIALSSDDFSTLVAAVTEAQLGETLQGEGPFTVFAPTNEAFANALAALDLTADELLASPELEGILTYHVVAGEIDSAAAIAAAGTLVPTVNGDTLEVSVVDGNVMIDGATVVTADLFAGNGIVHVIDSVILPAG
ncbi:MAG: fasciclin domain-containing protein [Acidimicrobiales bacterium]